MRDKHVAIAFDENGKCYLVSKVKVIDELTLNKLKNEEHERKAKEQAKEQELKEEIKKLNRDIFILKDLVKHLLGYIELEDMSVYEEYLGVNQNESEN